MICITIFLVLVWHGKFKGKHFLLKINFLKSIWTCLENICICLKAFNKINIAQTYLRLPFKFYYYQNCIGIVLEEQQHVLTLNVALINFWSE
jgi:hypothetical protein